MSKTGMNMRFWARWTLAVWAVAVFAGFVGGADAARAESAAEASEAVSAGNASVAESPDMDAGTTGEVSEGEGNLMTVRGEESVTAADYAAAMAALDQAMAEASAQFSQANSSGESAVGHDASDSMSRSLRRVLAPNTGFLEGSAPSHPRTAAASKGIGSFSASDSASDVAYEDGWTIGDNGGSGFKAWKQTGDSAPSREMSAQDGFVVGYDGGLGREFETPLVNGTFTVDAKHGFNDRFSGFALYTEDNTEVLRWGVTSTVDSESGREDVQGLWYAIATGGQNQYVLWSENRNLKDLSLSYSITWSQGAGGGLSFDLTALDAGNNIVGPLLSLSVDDVKAIYGVGVLVAGNSTSDKMSFNNLQVDGDPLRPVPEPSALLVLLLGAPLCALRRARLGKR